MGAARVVSSRSVVDFFCLGLRTRRKIWPTFNFAKPRPAQSCYTAIFHSLKGCDMSDMLELEKLIRPPISETTQLKTALEVPSDFRFDAVPGLPIFLPSPTPDLGPLAAFVGTFAGNGFNTIFRPDNPVTPTALPIPVSGDNILELNLTSETLSFSPSLGAVPNRGEVQGDINLNGVPYLQSIADVTTGQRIGIHFEPGLWMIVPATTNPPEGVTVVRMASI